jgi:predicted membrane-bound spermidine synthase
MFIKKLHENKLKIAFILATFSGFISLVYEILWTRRIIDLVGEKGDAISRILGIFFLGFALGAFIVSRFENRFKKNIWFVVGIVQLISSIFSIVVIYLPYITTNLWAVLGPNYIESPVGIIMKWIYSIIFLLLPATSLGMILPLFAKAAFNEKYQMEFFGKLLYAFNALGGVLGIILVMVFLLPEFGILVSGWILFVISLPAAFICFFIDTQKPNIIFTRTHQQKKEHKKHVLQWPAGLRTMAFLSGFLTIGMEIIYVNQFSQAMLNSMYSFALLLIFVLISLAIGAFLSGLFLKLFGSEYQKTIFFILGLTFISVIIEPYLLIFFTHGLRELQVGKGIIVYLMNMLKIGALTIFPVFILSGMIFPILFSWASKELKDITSKHWGFLLFLNGIGGAIGSELIPKIMMPYFGLWYSFFVFAIIYFGMFIFFAFKQKITISYKVRTSFVIILLLISIISAVFLRILPSHRQLAPGEKVIAIATGPEGVVITTRSKDGNLRIMLNNNYIIGGTASSTLSHYEMFIPLILHPDPERVGVLGMGTGLTADAALKDRNVKKLYTAEISPLITEMAKKYFSPFLTGGLFTSPRSKIIVDDGRIYFSSYRNYFDVIVSDLFTPWIPGTGDLYTEQTFETIKKALRQGGLFCQWLPLYQLTGNQVADIMKTFIKVFPNGQMITNSFAFNYPILGLIGFKKPGKLNWNVIKQNCKQIRQENIIPDAFLRHSQGIAMRFFGPINWRILSSKAKINTINNMLVEQKSDISRLKHSWGPLTGYSWWKYTEECINEQQNNSFYSDKIINAMKAGHAWLSAEKSTVFGNEEQAKTAIIKAISMMPTKIAEDPFFSWNDLLVDMPLKLYGQDNSHFRNL